MSAETTPPVDRLSGGRTVVRSSDRWARVAAWTFVIATAVLATSGLTRSLWWDEVYTAWAYVLRGPGTIRDPSAYIANNHVLFSGLTWATSRVLGTSEVVLRLWTVVPGMVAMAWLTLLVARRLDWTVAAVTAGLLALSPLHLRLVTEARGYGLVLLASVGLLAGATGAARSRAGWRDDLTLVVSAAVGTATVASMALPAAVVAGTTLVRRPRDRLRLLLLGGAAVMVVLAWYAPLLTPLTSSIGGVGARHGEQVTLLSPLFAPARLLLLLPLENGPVGGVLAGSAVGRSLIALLLGALVLAGGLLAVRRDPELGWPILVLPLATVAASGLLGMHLLPRYVSGLLPAIVVAAAVALTALGRIAHRRFRRATVIVVTLGAMALAVTAAPILIAERSPRQALKDAAQVVADADADQVLLTSDDVAWRYYLRDQPTVVMDHEQQAAVLCVETARRVVVVDPMLGTDSPPPCAEERGLVPVILPQRATPGFQRVWVPAAS